MLQITLHKVTIQSIASMQFDSMPNGRDVSTKTTPCSVCSVTYHSSTHINHFRGNLLACIRFCFHVNIETDSHRGKKTFHFQEIKVAIVTTTKMRFDFVQNFQINQLGICCGIKFDEWNWKSYFCSYPFSNAFYSSSQINMNKQQLTASFQHQLCKLCNRFSSVNKKSSEQTIQTKYLSDWFDSFGRFWIAVFVRFYVA